MRHLRPVAEIGTLLGLAWGLLVCWLAGDVRAMQHPAVLIGSALAGLAATAFTVHTLKPTDSADSPVATLISYYLGVIVWVFCLAPLNPGEALGVLTFYATLMAPLLLPLCRFSRAMVWRVYRSTAADTAPGTLYIPLCSSYVRLCCCTLPSG